MNFRIVSVLLLSTVATSTATKSDKVDNNNSHYRIFSKAGVDKIFVSSANSPKVIKDYGLGLVGFLVVVVIFIRVRPFL